MSKVKYYRSIDQIQHLSQDERDQLRLVENSFVFRANDYYLRLINWEDPHDPIRKLIIPTVNELEEEYGSWDASDEDENYFAPGCQHKYNTTALLLVSNVCGAYCRYCFRKRLFKVEENKEVVTDLDKAIDYIQSNEQISNVLLTGGDPLMLATSRIKSILARLKTIDHVKIIRFGSKMPVFNPMRIYEDQELLSFMHDFMEETEKKIYVVTHINHPREITDESKACFRALHETGALMVNQTPILKGINDDPDVLGDLLSQLSLIGVTPYYFFINRPVKGNADFVLPLKRVYDIVEQAKMRTSGLGKRVRLVMSHASGKIEILAIENNVAYLKYHQSKHGEYGKLMILGCSDEAAWFEDLQGFENHLIQKGRAD